MIRQRSLYEYSLGEYVRIVSYCWARDIQCIATIVKSWSLVGSTSVSVLKCRVDEMTDK